ncbi:hypothetical protein NK6_9474 [Bradyrhizobium diazoefficiens]|uniref:Uncharacterized protein n=1 Tax=Bradyrhizobium diazoefficiens TaxID=1355477 RepID=A0A0E4BXQ3_9BRAD|nr:hypothetical protein NK6_9474 [Bradyrhizobium diazoefficiens]
MHGLALFLFCSVHYVIRHLEARAMRRIAPYGEPRRATRPAASRPLILRGSANGAPHRRPHTSG